MPREVYGYARVSSKDQNLDRQIVQLKNCGIEERNILCDKASGKTFERKAWNSLVGSEANAPLLREGDLLVVVSLDRLGRNYQEIRNQWQHITQEIRADIKILDMPLLDTSRSENSLDVRFVADLVLQILSYTAEKERLSIRERQAQGVAAAKAKGKRFGRPAAEFPEDWGVEYADWKAGRTTATAVMKKLGLKRTTFYKLAKRYEEYLCD